MEKKAFAECIKRNRNKRHFTIEELSKITGLSTDRLIIFEDGEFSDIKSCELEAISRALDVPVIMLMKGGGLMHKLKRDGDNGTICEWEEY